MTGVSARVHSGEKPSPKADPQLVANLAHLRQMLMHLLAGLVHRLERRTGELELTAWLGRDRPAAARLRAR